MYSRIIKLPVHKSFFLFGPRGTGKTTWIKDAYPDALYLDLLDAEVYNELLAAPQRLERFIPRWHKDFIVIDEIQRIPELLNEVHRRIENNKERFILTGSSARKLRSKGVNLLGGRALTYSMHPFTAAELGKDFNFNHSLKFGNMPSVYTEINPSKYLKSYVMTYLEEEIRQEGLTRNLSAFSRFLEAASFSQGCPLNISAVARECSVERKVVEHYFSILDDLLLASFVPVFTRRAKRRMVQHSKFYYFDTGVYRALRPAGPLDSPEEIEGAAFESLLFQELKAVNDALDLGYSIYYWRTSNGLEVDFILYGPRGLIALETKRSGKLSGGMLSSLKSFVKDYPMARACLVYGGKRVLREGCIDVVPLEDLLKNLPSFLAGQEAEKNV